MKPLEAIRCTLPSCPCECFAPGKNQLRVCDTCKHGWVAHALDKLGYRHIFNLGMQVEVVQPNIVFDIASLMLYGAQATPIRLKILLDRLFGVLQHEEVLQVLHGFGWSYEDYARGYILQTGVDPNGQVLDKWTIATREEEHVILQQFLRFGETKSIAQEIILQDTKDHQSLYIKQTARAESEIKKFIERSNMTTQSYVAAKPFDSRHFFTNRLPYVPTGSRLMSPPNIASFSSQLLNRELRPPLLAATVTSPISTPPLGRLQTMLPVDYRRDHNTSSPSLSPTGTPKRMLGHSPISPSPQNLSTTPTSVQSTPPPYQSHKTPDGSESAATAPTMTLPVITHEEPEDAINYSIKDQDHHEQHNSIYGDRKVKHLRKSANPIKRQWLPSAGFGTTLIGPNGKKRVLCTACNKTFCDKGALKIHYSAVHLKEMHKCSVDGCDMMFSSRRSRNRHSANPNPKLHMPQKRVKLPDGATIIDNGSEKLELSSPPTMVAPSPVNTRSSILPLSGDSQDLMHPDQGYFSSVSRQLNFLSSPEKKLKLENEVEDDEEPKDLSIHEPKEVKSEMVEEVVDFGRNDPGYQRSVNRRKNMIPTRCAQMEDTYIMSDDNSNDKDPTSSKHSSRHTRYSESHYHQETGTTVEPETVRQNPNSTESNDSEEAMCESNHVEELKQEIMQEGLKAISMETENAKENERRKRKRGTIGREFPKIASLLAATGKPDVLDGSNSSHEERPDGLSVSSNASRASNEDADTDGSNDSLYQSSLRANGSHSPEADDDMNGIDWLDKENPKMCAACGKSFQNQFGVKIHYQNVHLKLMHRCNVEGCNAAFPSKRSRDRHSSNLNLHRKLLSTSDSDKDSDKSLRDDVLPMLYDTKLAVGCEDDSDMEIEPPKPTTNGHMASKSAENSEADETEEEEDNSEEKSEKDHINMNAVTNGADDDDDENDEFSNADKDEMVTCHICQIKVRDNLVLKEHLETEHPKEMFNCTVGGCEKIFSTRKSRNRHSQNHNLHRHLGSTKRVCTA